MKKKDKLLSERDKQKIKAASDLGLGEKLQQVGWGGLTAKETGRIGAQLKQEFRNTKKESCDY